ncbi:HSPB1 associated protein 1 isoform X2 [Rhodnius prolixus]|uniref:HSPB1 associated protein 1 isoform X2 n=1 Tax=Rhodnius prolixus TaxID=13249 RepID=UPI003D18F8AA
MFKTHEILSSKVPLVFTNLLDWECKSWSIEEWKKTLGESNDKYPFRKGCNKCSEEPIWETNCETSSLTVSEFFENFNKSFEIDNTWLYFDYKHLSTWFSEVFKDINWSCVGFPERGAEDSTLWIGTEGAHTPCHFDSYGCNIVAQLYGKKVWLLFDPLESNSLSPTRVPYEESSVYSDINFACTCHPFPDIKNARCVILQPGDILYVPKHWWHYVENVTSAISVNTWIPVY